MYVIGFILAGIMGMLLGMLGGGGSIMTVPILVYLMGIPDDIAPSYSFFVVGLAASIGSIQYLKNKQVSLRAAILFGIPSLITVYLNQHYLRPAIPATIRLLGMDMAKGSLLMVLFAVMMVLAAWSMIRKKNRQTPDAFEIGGPEALRPVQLILLGLAEGALTGLVGAGGGFIIVPILATVAKLPMKKAVGTSLVIMAAKSIAGILGAAIGEHRIRFDWELLLPFTALAAIGILVGARLSRRVPGPRLKVIFGWFILLMGTFVIVKTIIDG